MWWKKFIGSPVGISGLPRDRLEHLYQVSTEQLQKFQAQERALRSEIHDITVETSRQLQMAQQTTMTGMNPGSPEVCPPNYSASERRCLQLRASISQLMSDLEQIEDEIFEQEDILAQYLEQHHIETPIARESLMVGPFNNTELRRVFSQMSIMAETTLDEVEKEDLLFCLDVLSGESKILARRMEEMKSKFDEDCVAKQEELDSLVTNGLKLQHEIDKLGSKMNTLSRKSEAIEQISPNIRKELQKEIKLMGDTGSPLRQIGREVEKLKSERAELRIRLASVSSDMMSKTSQNAGKTADVEESAALQQRKTRLDLELHELEIAQTRNESNISGTREMIDQCRKEIEEIRQQCEMIREATTGEKWKFEKLSRANITLNDVVVIKEWSQKSTPNEMEKNAEQLREHVKLLEKRRASLRKRTSQLDEQGKQYERQIRELQGLLSSGRLAEEEEDGTFGSIGYSL
jgi:predicted  nucleic acid-binding Zn-ribbon protein